MVGRWTRGPGAGCDPGVARLLYASTVRLRCGLQKGGPGRRVWCWQTGVMGGGRGVTEQPNVGNNNRVRKSRNSWQQTKGHDWTDRRQWVAMITVKNETNRQETGQRATTG